MPPMSTLNDADLNDSNTLEQQQQPTKPVVFQRPLPKYNSNQHYSDNDSVTDEVVLATSPHQHERDSLGETDSHSVISQESASDVDMSDSHLSSHDQVNDTSSASSPVAAITQQLKENEAEAAAAQQQDVQPAAAGQTDNAMSDSVEQSNADATSPSSSEMPSLEAGEQASHAADEDEPPIPPLTSHVLPPSPEKVVKHEQSPVAASPPTASANGNGLSVQIPPPSRLTTRKQSADTSEQGRARYYVYLTHRQAQNESRKLKGYKYVPVLPDGSLMPPSTPNSAVTPAERPHRSVRDRAVKEEADYEEEVLPTQPTRQASITESPKLAKGRRPSVKDERRTSGGSISKPAEPANIDDSLERLQQLQQRLAMLQKLKAAQAAGMSVNEYEMQQQIVATPAPRAKAGKRKNAPSPHIHQIPMTPTFLPPSKLAKVESPPPPTVTTSGREVKRVQQLPQVELHGALKKFRNMLQKLIESKAQQNIFNTSVNYENPAAPYFAPNYLQVVGGRAMDLGTVKDKLTTGQYATIHDAAQDTRLVWSNAMKYNGVESWVHQAAIQLQAQFEREFKAIKDSEFAAANKPPRTAKPATPLTTSGAYASTAPTASPRRPLDDEWDRDSDDDKPAKDDDDEDFRPRQRNSSTRKGANDESDFEYDSDDAEKTALKKRVERMEKTIREKGAGGGGRYGMTQGKDRSMDQIPLSQRDKQALKEDIFRLPVEKAEEIVNVIQAANEAAIVYGEDEEVEIDIDKLDIPTLRQLQQTVKKALGSNRMRTPLSTQRSDVMSPEPMRHPSSARPSVGPSGTPLPSPSASEATSAGIAIPQQSTIYNDESSDDEEDNTKETNHMHVNNAASASGMELNNLLENELQQASGAPVNTSAWNDFAQGH